MKKLFLILLAGCLMSAAASAQTLPAGTKFFNPSLTNLSFNAITIGVDDEKGSTNRLGLQAMGGYAIMDDLAIVAGVGFQSAKYEDTGISALNLFAGARYYLPMAPGFYAGANLALGSATVKTDLGKSLDDDDFDIDLDSIKANTIGVELNVGYSYFLSSKVAVEPAISYTYGLSTKVSDQDVKLSMFTLNIGFMILL